MDPSSHRWRSPTGPLVPRRDPAVAQRRLAWASIGLTGASVVGMHRLQAAGGGWGDSVLFCAVLLAILGGHELGHVVVGRRHGLRLGWPVFLPAPVFVGTLGAILTVRDRPRSRAAALEVGAAGPLVGFGAIAAAIGLRMGFGGPTVGGELLGQPLVWRAFGLVLRGEVPPLTTADPVGYAAWVGCLVTAMNLLPFGQLDGGHIATALWPRPRIWAALVTVGLVGLGVAWPGWWAWLVAIWVVAARRPWPLDVGQAPTRRGLGIALAAAATWAACLAPIPW